MRNNESYLAEFREKFTTNIGFGIIGWKTPVRTEGVEHFLDHALTKRTKELRIKNAKGLDIHRFISKLLLEQNKSCNEACERQVAKQITAFSDELIKEFVKQDYNTIEFFDHFIIKLRDKWVGK